MGKLRPIIYGPHVYQQVLGLKWSITFYMRANPCVDTSSNSRARHRRVSGPHMQP